MKLFAVFWGLMGLLYAGIAFLVAWWIADGPTEMPAASVAAAAVLVGMLAVAGFSWRSQGRRARGFGLTTRRYVEVSWAVRRGRFPADPGEYAAARGQMERMSRGVRQQRGMRWLSWALAVLWSVFAVSQLMGGQRAFAALYSLNAAIWALAPLRLRRLRARLDDLRTQSARVAAESR